MADTIPYLVDENDPDLESGMVDTEAARVTCRGQRAAPNCAP